MPQPTVAVIIPTRNRIDSLKRLLSQIIPYVSAHPECSVVVSDDGDASETRLALTEEFSQVQVVQGPHRGPAANRNCGAAHSKGELIVFLDDDCVPASNLISVYQDAAYANPEIAIFEGRITAEGTVSSCADSAPSNETGGYLWSCNFAVRRELFEAIGGFDSRFPFAAMEDNEFHFRAKQVSSIRFLPDARVWHGFERRLGWKPVQHHSLSVLLYLHMHGLKEAERNSLYFLRMSAQIVLLTIPAHIRAGSFKDPSFLVYRVAANLQLALIILFWRYRASLATRFFPPCCDGCRRILSILATDSSIAAPIDEAARVR
jgi:GT2 family glycosyltransferase